MLEVEVKARVDDINKVEEEIRRLNAKLIKTQRQSDIYLNASHKDLWQTDEVLRIRKTSLGEHMLTYKGPRIAKCIKTREELEVSVENGEKTKRILEKLGFYSMAVVVKDRITYMLDNLSLNVDRVRDVGVFVEIEAIIEKKDQRKPIESKISNLLAKLGSPNET